MSTSSSASSLSSRCGRAALAAIAVVMAATIVATPAAAADQTPPGDPPGNNGTIKVIAEETSDTDPGNEPQIDGCLVWLEFYGYDLDQRSTIRFEAIPPTNEARELLSHTASISDDAAGGGQDKDATLSYNLSGALNGLFLDPDRGYHIKVYSDTTDAPGGAKQKVFWMRCAPAATDALQVSKTVEGEGAGPFRFDLRCNHAPLDRSFTLDAGGVLNVTDIPAGTVCVVTETDNRGANSTRIAETPSDGVEDGQLILTGGAAVRAVAFTNVFPAATVGDAGDQAPADAQAPAGDRLPETGSGTAVAAAAGLALVLTGALIVAKSRRPETTS